MKKSKFFLGFAAGAALLMMGCGAYNTVSFTQADGVNFHAFHTYQWLPDQSDTINTAYNNEIIRSKIRTAISHELNTRHLQPAIDDASADLALQLVIQTHDRSRDATRFTPGFYYGPFGGSYSNSRSYYEHQRWTLNLYERKTNHLVWTCTAEGDLNRAKDLEKNIQPAVERIMKKYPVQPAGHSA